MTQPTPANPFPQPVELPNPPTVADDPTGLTHDRGDLDETIPVPDGVETIPVGTRHTLTVPDLGCGHLPGECPNDAECAYWRGVLTGEYPPPEAYMAEVISLPPFNLRELAEQHITAAELERRERGAA
ncbi:hypothetical protein ACGFI9_37405 [Micromonospora sp. NPDC048930]|uniref:hypothetical protein n=1 Tax=Micromonospora sp. NPDC048930 TaxID=3364261 RepID=UPI00371C923A